MHHDQPEICFKFNPRNPGRDRRRRTRAVRDGPRVEVGGKAGAPIPVGLADIEGHASCSFI